MSPAGVRAIRGSAGLFAVVLIGYAAGAVLSWKAFGSTVGPAFFPPAGLTAAALLLTRRARWPVVVAAIALAEIPLDLFFGEKPGLALGYAAANAVEPLVGAALTLAWCGGRPDLRHRKDLARFVAGAVVAGPVVGALIGGGITAAAFGVWFPAALMHWFAGDAIGVLVVATPILLWPLQSRVFRERPSEAAGILGTVAVLSWAAFWTDLPPSLLILPVLAWAALRLNMIGAAVAGALVAFAANLMTIRGMGPFSDLDMAAESRLALAQVFIAVNVLVGLLIAQEAAARVTAVRERDVERRERLRLETLARLGQQLAAALTPHDIGQAVAEQVLNDAGAKAISLGLVSPDGKTLQWVTMAGFPEQVQTTFGPGMALGRRTAATDAVRIGQQILIPTREYYEEQYPDMTQWVRMSDTESIAVWPFSSGGKPIGVLLLCWSERQRFDAAQLAYISAVTTLVSQALVRARIYADEHARAAVLQAAVLPDSPAAADGFDVCISYEPSDLAQGIGGDWYDVMPLPKGRTYLAVGDVVGHGLTAVEDMAQLRSAGRALAHLGLPPGQLLSELNGFTKDASQGKFASMAVAVFDAGAGMLAYCCAGHPPPLLRRAATGEVLRLTAGHGPVLGPLADATYSEDRLHVGLGDILLMYTDGLVERRDQDIEDGISRAQRIIGGWGDGTDLTQACQMLQDELAPSPRHDDVCVVAVRFTTRLDCQ